jgi:hypothetical protein
LISRLYVQQAQLQFEAFGYHRKSGDVFQKPGQKLMLSGIDLLKSGCDVLFFH